MRTVTPGGWGFGLGRFFDRFLISVRERAFPPNLDEVGL
jgi:hypothetical protein